MCHRGRLRGQGRPQGLHLCITLLEGASNNLACALQFFTLILCTFCAAQNRSNIHRNLTKKGPKIELLLQKNANIFLVFFLRLRGKVTNFNTSPMPLPPFWKFFIRYIEQWTKTFCKKTGRPGRSETGRPAGQPAMILKFTGRVEKILTGSISATTQVVLLSPKFRVGVLWDGTILPFEWRPKKRSSPRINGYLSLKSGEDQKKIKTKGLFRNLALYSSGAGGIYSC